MFKKHYEKYLLKNTECIVKYEDLKQSFKGFSDIVNFLGFDNLNINKLKKLNKLVTKEALIDKSIDKRYFGNNLVEENYELERECFKKKYSGIISESLKHYF